MIKSLKKYDRAFKERDVELSKVRQIFQNWPVNRGFLLLNNINDVKDRGVWT